MILQDGPSFQVSGRTTRRLAVARTWLERLPISSKGDRIVDGLALPLPEELQQTNGYSCGYLQCLQFIGYLTDCPVRDFKTLCQGSLAERWWVELSLFFGRLEVCVCVCVCLCLLHCVFVYVCVLPSCVSCVSCVLCSSYVCVCRNSTV